MVTFMPLRISDSATIIFTFCTRLITLQSNKQLHQRKGKRVDIDFQDKPILGKLFYHLIVDELILHYYQQAWVPEKCTTNIILIYIYHIASNRWDVLRSRIPDIWGINSKDKQPPLPRLSYGCKPNFIVLLCLVLAWCGVV